MWWIQFWHWHCLTIRRPPHCLFQLEIGGKTTSLTLSSSGVTTISRDLHCHQMSENPTCAPRNRSHPRSPLSSLPASYPSCFGWVLLLELLPTSFPLHLYWCRGDLVIVYPFWTLFVGLSLHSWFCLNNSHFCHCLSFLQKIPQFFSPIQIVHLN